MQSLRGRASAEDLLAACQDWAMPSNVEDGDVRCGHKINTESIVRR